MIELLQLNLLKINNPPKLGSREEDMLHKNMGCYWQTKLRFNVALDTKVCYVF